MSVPFVERTTGRFEMRIVLGSTDFFGVPFPLVLADRFFHVYTEAGTLKLDVFRWDEQARQAVYEVIASEPQADAISTNPTGIVTFSQPETGTFLYKFRPRPNVSQIFGTIPIDRETEVRITDHEIKVVAVGVDVCTIQRGKLSGFPIGIRVGADGSLSLGVKKLPDGMTLERRIL